MTFLTIVAGTVVVGALGALLWIIRIQKQTNIKSKQLRNIYETSIRS